ncbi:MAG: outer membrane beta-barrel protein [Ignavibacteriales bacterium]|nr:outer membrane beta-barrel protein [Ignavibacteriales bacterium]
MYSTRYELALKPYITFFYTDGKGKAQSVSINEPDGRLVRTTMNLGSIRTYGCDLTLMFSPWSISFIPYPEWWSMGNLMVSYRKSIEKGSAEYFGSQELWEVTKDVWMVNSFASIRPGYDFDLTIGYLITPGYSNVREKNLSTSNLYMSLSHSFLDEKLNIALNANDLLNSSNTRAWRYGSNYSSYSKFDTENSRNIAINISWKFNDYRYREKRDIKDGRD